MSLSRLLALGGLLVLAGCIEDSAPSADRDDDGAAGDAAPVDGAPDVAPDVSPSVPDVAVPDAAGEDFCNEDAECGEGGRCIDSICQPPECRDDSGCNALQACRDFVCRDRCGNGIPCFRGGICEAGACVPPQCEADGDCEGDLLCREGRCIEPSPCNVDGDCGGDERCLEGNCEPLAMCVGDRNCAGDEICEGGRCRPRGVCADDRDCAGGEDCVGGRCVPFVCRGDADCEAGERCRAGACEPPAMVEVASVVILTRPRTLFVGQTLALRAVGLDLRGDIVAVDGFEWESSVPPIVAVDAGGLASAGPEAGEVAIVASRGAVASAPLALRVEELTPPEGLRVRVSDAATGAPVAGATVRADALEAVTGDDGTAHFPEPAAAPTITVFSEAHDYVTLVGAAGSAIHLPVWPRSDDARVAGFTGSIDFGAIEDAGAVELGLAGASIAGGLTHLDFEALLGQIFSVEVNAGVAQFALPLPGGLTLSAEVPVLGRIELKDDFAVVSHPGLRLGWSFAGRIDLQALFGLAGGGGGGFDVGTVLATLLPFFERFEHGLRVAENLVALPRRPDANDVDGDGDTAELVPDYGRFPVLNMEPEQAQRLRLQVDVPALPGGGEGTPVALLFAGAELTEVGFVPLGLGSATEAGPVPMRLAAPYAGLEAGDPVVLAVAARFGGGAVLPASLSAVVSRHPGRLPEAVALDDFLPPPDGVEWDPALRRLTAGAVDAATVHRAVFRGAAGRWTVYFPEGAAPAVSLPFPPEGRADLAGGSDLRFEALRLDGGLDALLGEDGTGSLLDLDARVTGFSRAVP